MITSVRRTTLSLTAFVLATAVVAGCAGTGDDSTHAGAPMPVPSAPASSPASASPSPGTASPSSPGADTSVSPSASGGPGPNGSAGDYPGLPASASGRTPVFRHGPRGGQDGGGNPDGENERDRTVALTFDAVMAAGRERDAERGERFDNPGLIDTLRREKVPATVFMTGVWARTYRDQARAVGRDPLFEVGNLSHSHRAFTPGCHDLPVLDPARQREDVDRGRAEIRAAGVENLTPYFRFPGGCHDDRALRAVARTGVTAVRWDVVGGDSSASDPRRIAERILADVRPGSVVALHANRTLAPATEQAVRLVVPELRERGYRFVRVSELIATGLG